MQPERADMTSKAVRSPSGRATHERSQSVLSPPPVGVPNAVEIAQRLSREERRWLLATPRQFPSDALAIVAQTGWKYGGGSYAKLAKRHPLLFTRMRVEQSPCFAYRLTKLGCEVAIAIEARQRTDPEEGLDPKGESAGPKDIAQGPSQ